MKKLFYRLSGVTAGIVVGLIVLEIALRVLDLGYGNLPVNPDPVLHHVFPKNYVYTVHDPGNEYGGYKIYFNSEGIREDPAVLDAPDQAPDPEEARYRVAFMGDSFTLGMRVLYEDTFVGLLDATSGDEVVVKNYGVRSYSPILYILQWKNLVSKFKPMHVVLQLYSNDITDDVKWEKTAEYSEDGSLLGVHGEGPSYNKYLRHSYLVRLVRKFQQQISWMIKHRGQEKNVVGGLVEENPDLTEMSTGYVLELAREVRKSGAEFILTVVPSKYRLVNNRYDDPDPEFSDKWKAWAEDNSIEFIDLVPAFVEADREGRALFWEKDIHFQKDGHMVTAHEIRSLLPQIFQYE